MLQSLKKPLELMWLPARVSIENWKIAHMPVRPLSYLELCSSSSTRIQSVKMAQQRLHDLPQSAAVVKCGCRKVWLSWSAVPEKCCCRKDGVSPPPFPLPLDQFSRPSLSIGCARGSSEMNILRGRWPDTPPSTFPAFSHSILLRTLHY